MNEVNYVKYVNFTQNIFYTAKREVKKNGTTGRNTEHEERDN